jgi:transcriptional regulator with XRE-family HTH domain
MSMAKQPTVTERLRAAILAAGVTQYRIAEDTGVNRAALSRFIRRQRGLDGSSIDVLAEYLGLDLLPAKRRGKGR